MSKDFDQIVLYYFSGTGNSFSVANWIQRVAKESERKVNLINIATLKHGQIQLPEKSMIGFISPTHGFNFPPLVLHFLLRFPKSRSNSAFIVNTRGGLKMNKFFLPGLSGMAQYLSALILLIKGYRVLGMRPIDLPSNWISLHPGLKSDVVASIYHRRKIETEVFTKKILMGLRDYRALFDLIQDILITPIGIMYYLFGRFFLAKSFIATSNCNNCNRCIEQCPVNAIKLVDERPFWTHNCESCMQCMNNCPERAIETAHGFLTGVWILIDTVILFQLYRLLNLNSFFNLIEPSVIGYLLQVCFDMAIFLFCVFMSYKAMHYLMRFTLVEKLIFYTSLTRFDFWRRYRVKKIKFWKQYRFPKLNILDTSNHKM